MVIHYNKSYSKAKSLKKELENLGAKIYLIKGDLSKEKDIKKIIKIAKNKLKYFDCLINNASIFENDKLNNFDSRSWDKHLSINLKAPALLIREFSKNVKIKNKSYSTYLVKAFQRKYRQNLINGKIDQECFLISKNLVKT